MRLLFTISLLAPFISFSQIFDQDVISTSGDYYESASFSIGWTVGEVSIDYYLGSNNYITEGFWNEIIGPTSIYEEKKENLISIFPNPTSGELDLIIPSPINNLDINVTNGLGQLVYSSTNITDTNLLLDLGELSPGFYLITFISNTEIIETQKIQKL